jgi:hypothetical protein
MPIAWCIVVFTLEVPILETTRTLCIIAEDACEFWCKGWGAGELSTTIISPSFPLSGAKSKEGRYTASDWDWPGLSLSAIELKDVVSIPMPGTSGRVIND